MRIYTHTHIHICSLVFMSWLIVFLLLAALECVQNKFNSGASYFRESKIVLLSSDEIDAIEKITVGQADNEAWHQQREGRITASNFYRVFTKVESMKASKENSADKLVDSLCGKS